MRVRCRDAVVVGTEEISDGPRKPNKVWARIVHRGCFEKDRNYFEKQEKLSGTWNIIHEQVFYDKDDKSTHSCRICGKDFEKGNGFVLKKDGEGYCIVLKKEGDNRVKEGHFTADDQSGYRVNDEGHRPVNVPRSPDAPRANYDSV